MYGDYEPHMPAVPVYPNKASITLYSEPGWNFRRYEEARRNKEELPQQIAWPQEGQKMYIVGDEIGYDEGNMQRYNKVVYIDATGARKIGWAADSEMKQDIENLERDTISVAEALGLPRKAAPKSTSTEATVVSCENCQEQETPGQSLIKYLTDIAKAVEQSRDTGHCFPSKIGQSMDQLFPPWSHSDQSQRDRVYCKKLDAKKFASNPVCRNQHAAYPLTEAKDCREALALRACKNSIWRNLSMQQRIHNIQNIAKKINPAMGLSPYYSVCMAARETGDFSLNKRTESFCKNSDNYRASGLFQITPTTNADTVRIGAFERYLKTNDTAKAILRKHLSPKTYAFLLDPDAKNPMGKLWINKKKRRQGIQGNQNYLLCTNNKDCKEAQKELYDKLVDNPELQILVANVIMLVKGGKNEEPKKKIAKNELESMLKKYYGSQEKGNLDPKYAKRILSCIGCFESEKNNKHRCSVLARNDHSSYGEPTLAEKGFNYELYERTEKEECNCETR